MNVLAAVSIGLLAGAGVLLIVAGMRGNPILPRPNSTRSAPSADRELAWLTGSVVAALVAGALTGWVVVAAGSGIAVWSSRGLIARGRESGNTVQRTEAIAVWTEQIRDNMAAAAGLEQALLASAAHAPGPIDSEVSRFVSRIDRGVDLLDALAELGDDLDHPAADLVVVALANAVRLEARDLGPLLSRLAIFIRADVRMRLRIEVSRARIRTSARIVLATTVVTALFLFVFSPNLLTAYDSVAGQLWLLVVFGVFAAAGSLMRSLATTDYPGRFSARRAAFGPGR
ncbi:MAG: type II secretion system F family protein [Acidimicrobiales bacterium]|nr:type II secretion system F family protein [Acidimicrobiales bacterium]